jgi:hypothetical protein
VAGRPHPALRSLLPRGYAGFTEATTPRHLVLPATASVPLVVKLADSPHRPPHFLMGAHGVPLVVDGDCARSYLEVWLAPKTAARLVRFNEVWRRLEGQAPDWADLARDAGYADQAHLVRDFRQLTGMTPTAYLAQVNSVQAAVASAS